MTRGWARRQRQSGRTLRTPRGTAGSAVGRRRQCMRKSHRGRLPHTTSPKGASRKAANAASNSTRDLKRGAERNEAGDNSSHGAELKGHRCDQRSETRRAPSVDFASVVFRCCCAWAAATSKPVASGALGPAGSFRPRHDQIRRPGEHRAQGHRSVRKRRTAKGTQSPTERKLRDIRSTSVAITLGRNASDIARGRPHAKSTSLHRARDGPAKQRARAVSLR